MSLHFLNLKNFALGEVLANTKWARTTVKVATCRKNCVQRFLGLSLLIGTNVLFQVAIVTQHLVDNALNTGQLKLLLKTSFSPLLPFFFFSLFLLCRVKIWRPAAALLIRTLSGLKTK